MVKVEWQPIETAPVNESVLIFIPSPIAEHYGPAIYRGLQVEILNRRVWKVTGLHFGSDCGTSNHPSHWMPLPDPPTTQRNHATYCGLAAEHEGECVAVVTRMMGV